MTATAINTAYNIVRTECADQLNNPDSDLMIKDQTIERIKRVFNHFRVSHYDSFPLLIQRIQQDFCFAHAVYFYESDFVVHAIFMLRETEFENVNRYRVPRTA